MNVEGSGSGLKILSRYMLRGNEKNYINLGKNNRYMGRDSKLEPDEY
jgi:hypothetical protein